jgi:hypothetical protein
MSFTLHDLGTAYRNWRESSEKINHPKFNTALKKTPGLTFKRSWS